MTNEQYWARRSKEQARRVDAEIEKICTTIEQAYAEAAKNISEQIERWYNKFADDNGISLAAAKRTLDKGELDDFKMTLQEYIQHGEKLNTDPSWLAAMKNASAKHHIDRLNALNMTTSAEIQRAFSIWRNDAEAGLDRVLMDTFLRTSFNLDVDIGTMQYLNGADINKLRSIANLPWAPDGMDFKRRMEVNNAKMLAELQKQLMQGCITGRPYEEMAAGLRETIDLKKYESERLIKTEATHVSTVAERESYLMHGVKEYEFLATLDHKTCDICGPLDGQHFKISEMIEGTNAPPMHPNCRCDTIPYYDSAALRESRAARDEKGKTKFISGDITWEDWKTEQLKMIEIDRIERRNLIEAAKGITPEIIKAIKEREKEVSRDLMDQNIRYRQFRPRSGDEWVEAMQTFHTSVGADGLPITISRDYYDSISSPTLYRGLADISMLRDDITTTLKASEMAEQFITGSLFPSRGIYGDCAAYMSTSPALALSYATTRSYTGGRNKIGSIIEAKLNPGARTIKYKDAKKLFNDLHDAMPDDPLFFSKNQRRLSQGVEVGKAMNLLGYDAIIESNGDGLRIPFYMILNRHALLITEDWKFR